MQKVPKSYWIAGRVDSISTSSHHITCVITLEPQNKTRINHAWILHYRIFKLCRVSVTLGKGQVTLGKVFAKCNTRQTLWRRRGLCREPNWTRQNGHVGLRWWWFCRGPNGRKSAKIQTSPSAGRVSLGKDLKLCRVSETGTQQSLNLCWVPSLWHSAKFEYLPSA